MRVTTLIGVYHARGSLAGEIAYLFEKVTGRGHCALCDITHGRVRRRRSFDECVLALDLPFDLYHLDDQPEAVARASAGRTPLILARLDDGSLHELMAAADLESCTGSPERLQTEISARILDKGWSR